MPDSASEKLALVKEISIEGTIEDALQLVKDIEQMENLTPEEMLKTLYYKGVIYLVLGQFQIVVKIADELYQKSLEMKMSLFSLDALHIKEWIYIGRGDFEDLHEIIEQHENLFNSIPREDSSEFQEREAALLIMKGRKDLTKGNLNLALDYFNKSYYLATRANIQFPGTNDCLSNMAIIYRAKGELKLALECDKKALSLTPDGEFHLGRKANIYRNIGNTYEEKGDLNKALEYQTHALETYNKTTAGGYGKAFSYGSVISILLAQKNINQARNYLEQFKRFNEKYENKVAKATYQLARALILKSSSRMRDRTEAENILKNIVEKDRELSITLSASVNLCDLYFEEFRLSNQMDVLDDIHPLISRLQRITRDSNSYSYLAHIKLLQAKLALLQINMVGARKLLTEAQQIADEHDLQLLASDISREHDRLLEELKLWESFKKTQASVSERLKLASIDGVMERLQGKRAIEVPEVSVEEPILLLIMDNSGVSYFNHSFIGDWDFDDLFSSFMSAFNTFSGEIFSRSIDRIKIGENTILINPVEPFLACYVIKGQSYPAQQKLTRFSDAIKASPEIWEALNRAVKTSEMLDLDNPSSLGSTVNEIFV